MKVKRCFLEWSLVSRRFAVALTFVLGGGMLLAANLVPLKGVVKDASGEPLAGVTVRIKDGKSGTITDVNGHFVLDVEKGLCCGTIFEDLNKPFCGTGGVRR